jgi:hypothetical protein
MELWDTCNSLRYGFDEEYDRMIFEDEETREVDAEEEELWWMDTQG